MLITRNRPGVATCDNCKKPTRPVVSWSLADDTSGLGVEGLGAVHLCVDCLSDAAEQLGKLPPFLEVMRAQLVAANVEVAPKARYTEVRDLYKEHGLEAKAAVELTLQYLGRQTTQTLVVIAQQRGIDDAREVWGKPRIIAAIIAKLEAENPAPAEEQQSQQPEPVPS